MTLDEMIEIDRLVRHGLGVGRGQSIDEVARRIVRDAMPGPVLNAAREIVRAGNPWACMRAAADHLRPRVVH